MQQLSATRVGLATAANVYLSDTITKSYESNYYCSISQKLLKKNVHCKIHLL